MPAISFIAKITLHWNRKHWVSLWKIHEVKQASSCTGNHLHVLFTCWHRKAKYFLDSTQIAFLSWWTQPPSIFAPFPANPNLLNLFLVKINDIKMWPRWNQKNRFFLKVLYFKNSSSSFWLNTGYSEAKTKVNQSIKDAEIHGKTLENQKHCGSLSLKPHRINIHHHFLWASIPKCS